MSTTVVLPRATGTNGVTPEFTIGTVTTGPAAVTQTGTLENPVLNFVFPTGGGGGVSPPFLISDVTGLQSALDSKAPTANPTFTGTVAGINAAMVGLGNVNNTSDAAKPVSTATQAALDLKQPLDADLTALAAAAGTNTIYYRSAANTWSAVTIGTNLTFSSGTLSAAGGGNTKAVATVADLSTIPTPVVGDSARVTNDPLGDVTNGNGVWSWNGTAWTWIGPWVDPVVQGQIAHVTVADRTNASQRPDDFDSLAARTIEASLGASTASFVPTQNVAGGFDAEVTVGGRYFMVSTDFISRADRVTRWTVDATITRIDSGTWGIGVAVGSGAGRKIYQYRANGGIVVVDSSETATDLAVGGAALAYTTSDSRSLSLTRNPDGSGLVRAIKNGVELAVVPVPSGIPTGVVWLAHRGDGAVRYRQVFQETQNTLITEGLAVAGASQVSINERAALYAMQEFLRPLAVSLPDWFTWSPGFRIYTRGDGTFFTDYDPMQVRPFADADASVTLYVDVATGSDSNPGTAALPLKSIYAAVNGRFGNVRVLVKPGLYGGNDGWRDGNPASTNLIVEPWPGTSGRIVSSRHWTGLSWTLSSGQAKTYQATAATVASVFDANRKDAHGDYEPLTLRASISEVEANPNSYYVNGTTVYVHQQGAGSPGANIRVYADVRNARYHGTGTVWVKDVDFEGGRHPFHIASTAALPARNYAYMDGCSFKYSAGSATSARNGFNVTGECVTFLKSCVAAKNMYDGFNYHTITTVAGSKPRSVEIDCIGRGNGLDLEADTHNGSTTHDGGIVLRIGGSYPANKNRSVHDVNSAVSLNFGCEGGDSFGAVNLVSFAAGVTPAAGLVDETIMGLVDCVSRGNLYDLETVDASVIKELRLTPQPPTVVPGSTVSAYP